MAKKKASHSNQEKPLQKQQEIVKPNQQATPVMDSEASEKLCNLKSLNQMLLKETIERRQQVDSLLQSKGCLESELTRSNSEMEALRSELTRLGESAVRVELEKSVVSVFVAVQMRRNGDVIEQIIEDLEKEVRELNRVIDEKELEIGTLSGKLTATKNALGNWREVLNSYSVEMNGMDFRQMELTFENSWMSVKLHELEESKKGMELEIGELRVAHDGAVVEKEESEKRIESTMKEKDSLERELMDLNKLISETKDELQMVLKEKEVIKAERIAEMVRRLELEKLVSGLSETVTSLQKEEEELRVNLSELENKCLEAEEKQKEMGKEIDRLVEEKKLSENRVEGLIDEKNVVEKNLDEAMNQLDDERHKTEDLVSEKKLLRESQRRLVHEVNILRNYAAERTAVILKLEESYRVKEDKNMDLESVVGQYKFELEQVKAERDEIGNCLDKEKKDGVKLNEQMEIVEKKIEESLKVAMEAKAENGAISIEKMNLESQRELLKKEIASLKKALVEAQNELSSMKVKVESTDSKSELVVNMLKDAAAFCSNDEINTSEQINGEETMPSVMEFELIKNAFKCKEAKIDSMKKQLELLQNSVKEADKKKSFWAVLSSATTLLAAVSLAYVARGTGR